MSLREAAPGDIIFSLEAAAVLVCVALVDRRRRLFCRLRRRRRSDRPGRRSGRTAPRRHEGPPGPGLPGVGPPSRSDRSATRRRRPIFRACRQRQGRVRAAPAMPVARPGPARPCPARSDPGLDPRIGARCRCRVLSRGCQPVGERGNGRSGRARACAPTAKGAAWHAIEICGLTCTE